MKVRRIFYDHGFLKEYQSLPKRIRQRAKKAEKIFRENALYPSLRLHKLSGRMSGHWSLSVDLRYRIIFVVLKTGDVLFVSIGTHAIYE